MCCGSLVFEVVETVTPARAPQACEHRLQPWVLAGCRALVPASCWGLATKDKWA